MLWEHLNFASKIVLFLRPPSRLGSRLCYRSRVAALQSKIETLPMLYFCTCRKSSAECYSRERGTGNGELIGWRDCQTRAIARRPDISSGLTQGLYG